MRVIATDTSELEPTEFLKRVGVLQTKLVPIWEKGRPPKNDAVDGPHWTFPGTDRPVSVGHVESYFLFNFTRLTAARVVFEIGTGFGYSSWWLAAGMLPAPERWLGSLDNYSEGSLATERLEFARFGAKYLGFAEFVHYFTGSSPNLVMQCIGGRAIDIAFIDGNHHGEQPLLDYQAVQPHLSERPAIIFHDVNPRYAVERAISRAVETGWIATYLHTSCDLVVCVRNEGQQRKIDAAYKSAREFHLISAAESP